MNIALAILLLASLALNLWLIRTFKRVSLAWRKALDDKQDQLMRAENARDTEVYRNKHAEELEAEITRLRNLCCQMRKSFAKHLGRDRFESRITREWIPYPKH